MRIFKKWQMAGILVAGLLVACTPRSGAEKEISQGEVNSVQNRIEKIYLDVQDEKTLLFVQSKGHLAYTAVKEHDPPGVRLYFPDTLLASDALPLKGSAGSVLSVSAESISETEVRLSMILAEDMPYEVKSQGDSGIRIAVGGVSSDGRGDGAGSQGRIRVHNISRGDNGVLRLLEVKSEIKDDGVRVGIMASSSLKDVHTFTLENPPRIVLDIAGLVSPFTGEQRFAVDSPHVRSVRHYAYPDKVRVVLDTDVKGLGAFEGSSVTEGYEIFVAKAPSLLHTAQVKKREDKALVVSEKPALVKDMGFTQLPEGRSQLFIETDRPVVHEVISEGKNRVRLSLANTRLPERYQRPLITTRFESALDQVMPQQGASGATFLLIDMREPVAYVVNPQGNRLEVRFEASSVGPRPIEGAFAYGEKEAVEVASQSIAISYVNNNVSAPAVIPAVPSTGQSEVVVEPKVGLPKPPLSSVAVFTGTPISIDFFDTDIKNVFRILQHISGKNFAIDKDVAGKVTMSLEHPVPWDQIMDLVLRMNGLGMVHEGNIIRIATMTTLRREESLRQEVLRARQENEQRESDLAPLVTEYILINYSNVSSEIIPHIQNVLTERGRVSADNRNNQLIIRDTAEVIASARTIIEKIDKITPQVVIEARIVEASDSFARALGAEWQGSSRGSVDGSDYATINRKEIGGKYGYNVSMNTPTGTGSIGLHFARIAGTQLALNARLNLSEQRGETKIVSSPRIVTLDNKKATIKQGFQYPYQSVDKDGNPVTEFKDINLELEVTPHVTADNRVAMAIKILKDDLYMPTSDGWALQTKEVQTELLVNDGDTIVIGGVVQTSTSFSQNRIPFFHRIPLLGWLFKSADRSERKDELLIFLTPRIVQLENSMQ
ncbi:type IV pilus secretin family protein [Desulfobotulus mexicanus]|uniref:Type IV pilus secretin PilQ n=1 Tax=Desulfobotulus mexicanus TaxID=2586642 RepID=A0A5Q4VEN4_9BACT|nr:type IV pilus secretin family protein [Desulfobotulus mexicanus]TYT76105.1 type IV pilus secretin PilQ [Desulfobotulus mexicanus]